MQQVLYLNNRGEKGTFASEQAHPYVYSSTNYSTVLPKGGTEGSAVHPKKEKADSLRMETQAFHYALQVAPRL